MIQITSTKKPNICNFTARKPNFVPKQAENSYEDTFIYSQGKENEVKSIKEILKKDPDIIEKLNNKDTIDPQILKVKKAFKDPQILEKLFEDESIVEKFASYAEKSGKTKENATCTNSPVSFGRSILKQNPLWGGKTKREKARNIINRYALASAVVGGISSQVPGVDLAALSVSTMAMTKKLAKLYNVPWSKNMKKLATVVTTGGTAASLATGVVQIVPGAGNLVNGTFSFAIDKSLGLMLLELFEAQERGEINIEKFDKESLKNNGMDVLTSVIRVSSKDNNKKEAVRNTVSTCTLASAVVGGMVSKIPGASVATTTASNMIMIKKLASIYHIPWSKDMMKKTGIVLETALEASTGNIAASLIPVIGTAVGIQWSMVVGRAVAQTFINLFEAQKRGEINIKDVSAMDLKKETYRSIKDFIQHEEREQFLHKDNRRFDNKKSFEKLKIKNS